MAEKVRRKYQIKNRDGKVCMAYEDGSCHYSLETLRNMKQNGYKLYIDGKLWKDDSKKSKKGVVK